MGRKAMSQEQLVSVIIPTYNTNHKMLEESIKSILRQTYRNFILYVIDDGSNNDDNYNFIRSFFTDERLVVLKNDINSGVAKTLNRALDLAEGKYVFRMDADDIAVPTRLEEMVRFFETKPDISIAGSYAKCFGKRNNIVKLPLNDIDIRCEMIFNNPLCHPTVAFKKDCIDRFHLRYPENASNEDYNLWVSLLTNKEIKFANLSKILLFYRVHEAQVTFSKYDRLKTDSKKIISRVMDYYLGRELTPTEMESYVKTIYSKEKITSKEFETMLNIFREIISHNQKAGIVENDNLRRTLLKKSQNAYTIQIMKFRNKIDVYGLIKSFGCNSGSFKSDLLFSAAALVEKFI